MNEQNKLQILMVEDDEDLCSGWKDLFSLLGHCLDCFQRALEALHERAALDRCHLIITDYYLPDLNGIELIKRCRMLRPRLPAILLTGSKEDTVMTAAKGLADCRILHKPVNIEELDGQIRAMCATATDRRVFQ